MAESAARLPFWRSLLIIVLAGVLAALLLGLFLPPFRQRLARRYLDRGDGYLVEQDFEAAQREYRTALGYDPGLGMAGAHLELAERAPSDIAVAKQFYAEHGVTAVLDRLATAQKPYGTPKEALQAGADLYVAGQFSYAQYALQRAVSLDAGYSEAWQYLYLDYRELAKIDAAYRGKAEQARVTRDGLTPKYAEEERKK